MIDPDKALRGQAAPSAPGKQIRHRRFERRMVAIKAELRTPLGARHSATITDISEDGCSLEMSPSHRLEVGKFYCLKLGNLEVQSGCTVWSDNGIAGLQFAAPISSYVVDHLAQGSPARRT